MHLPSPCAVANTVTDKTPVIRCLAGKIYGKRKAGVRAFQTLGLVRAQVQRQKHRALCWGKQAGPALREDRRQGRQDAQGPSWESIRRHYTGIWCFPLAEHKMHKHALFRPQVAHNVKLGRFCIKIQILSSSGNMRKPDDTASIFLQNDCRLGSNSSCSQRKHTLSNQPRSHHSLLLSHGACVVTEVPCLASVAICALDKVFCPHNGIPQIHSLRPRVVEFHVQ